MAKKAEDRQYYPSASQHQPIDCKNPNHMEPQSKQERILYVVSFKKALKLRNITEKITIGPLMSIFIDNQAKRMGRMACIIFQNGDDARKLLAENEVEKKFHGQSLFGLDATLEQGGLWPEDDEIRAMTGPRRERRRLTFAKSQLYALVSRAKFAEDVERVAGAENVELLWLFNTGNATVVFTSVRVARAVRKVFLDCSEKLNSVYRGVIVSFSSDPCEKPLRLVTQMVTGPEARMAGS